MVTIEITFITRVNLASLSILQFSPQVLTINVFSDFSGYFMEAFKQSDPDSPGAIGLGLHWNDNIKLAHKICNTNIACHSVRPFRS